MQFGSAFQRFIQQLVYANPQFGPPLMAKIDLTDGFYRVPLSLEAALELTVVLSSDGASGPLIGIPLSLPMGWAHSPPYFCAFTETSANLTNQHTILGTPFPPHALEATLQTTPYHPKCEYAPMVSLPMQQHPPALPLQYTDVYMDDFLAAAQHQSAPNQMRTLLHCIDAIFQDLLTSTRRQIISQSKVLKGDAAWSHQKRILGWDIDSHTMTLHLPPHCQLRLVSLLEATRSMMGRGLHSR
jgi:hypothetical protein